MGDSGSSYSVSAYCLTDDQTAWVSCDHEMRARTGASFQPRTDSEGRILLPVQGGLDICSAADLSLGLQLLCSEAESVRSEAQRLTSAVAAASIDVCRCIACEK